MQDLIKNMHSKRFLLIYLVVVAFLLLIYRGQQSTLNNAQALKLNTEGAYQLKKPVSLPNFLLRDARQRLYTNADLQGRWHFVYIYDGACQPQCQAIWQVLSNLADRYAGQQLAFWVIDASEQQQLLNSSPSLPANIQIIYDPSGERSLWQFFVDQHGADALLASLFVIDPNGQWQAGYQAPFTSAALQQLYLQLRGDFAKAS
ncbi:MAG: redoxin domain-containing protein [Methylophaga sp.]|nr:redoxin domain-containing protein [Methylophaga sp.]